MGAGGAGSSQRGPPWLTTARSSRDLIKLGGHHMPIKEKTVLGAIAARGEGAQGPWPRTTALAPTGRTPPSSRASRSGVAPAVTSGQGSDAGGGETSSGGTGGTLGPGTGMTARDVPEGSPGPTDPLPRAAVGRSPPRIAQDRRCTHRACLPKGGRRGPSNSPRPCRVVPVWLSAARLVAGDVRG